MVWMRWGKFILLSGVRVIILDIPLVMPKRVWIVAVVAFKLVVTLDMTRRSNNQKVMAVKVQMQQMMCTLFQYVIGFWRKRAPN
jgi:hypothetical protein